MCVKLACLLVSECDAPLPWLTYLAPVATSTISFCEHTGVLDVSELVCLADLSNDRPARASEALPGWLWCVCSQNHGLLGSIAHEKAYMSLSFRPWWTWST